MKGKKKQGELRIEAFPQPTSHYLCCCLCPHTGSTPLEGWLSYYITRECVEHFFTISYGFAVFVGQSFSKALTKATTPKGWPQLRTVKARASPTQKIG
ncbi:hypothetical protein Y032_0558g3435 [Ancylostoma ceylanicum]|uniref:Uncharacterized protein n=1 Tax=Ancylostoma ceylanicum TaxID=53326 RepID=A0A016WRW0_9BILA|nr:hypothetical protein Y032_0558g3435 [Ancylostoma ceylanicum]